MPGVLSTPHLGASTEEAQTQVAVEGVGLLVDFLTTGAIRHAVNMTPLDPKTLAEPARLSGRRPIGWACCWPRCDTRADQALHAEISRRSGRQEHQAAHGQLRRRPARRMRWTRRSTSSTPRCCCASGASSWSSNASSDMGAFSSVMLAEVETDERTHKAAGTRVRHRHAAAGAARRLPPRSLSRRRADGLHPPATCRASSARGHDLRHAQGQHRPDGGGPRSQGGRRDRRAESRSGARRRRRSTKCAAIRRSTAPTSSSCRRPANAPPGWPARVAGRAVCSPAKCRTRPLAGRGISFARLLPTSRVRGRACVRARACACRHVTAGATEWCGVSPRGATPHPASLRSATLSRKGRGLAIALAPLRERDSSSAAADEQGEGASLRAARALHVPACHRGAQPNGAACHRVGTTPHPASLRSATLSRKGRGCARRLVPTRVKHLHTLPTCVGGAGVDYGWLTGV